MDYGISSNRNVDEIVVLKFLRDGIESCVIVQDELNLDSKMENVLNAGDVLEDLELETDGSSMESGVFDDVWNVADCKFIIRTKHSDFSLKWKQFKTMTVKTFTKLKNVHGSFCISIVKKI